MDEPLGMKTEQEMETEQEISTAEVEATSSEFLHAWKQLISTTNWEKGRIICRWRQALIETDAPTQSYSDEAWSRRVGGVTGQHVGRLRRVYERFGQSRQQYSGLYWSHFQAASDWNDAEMWLEGAVQGCWSVARMRDQRWEAMGAGADKKPRDEDIIVTELDEDGELADDLVPETISESSALVQPADDELSAADVPVDVPDDVPLAPDQPPVEPVRPFENLPQLPDDLNEAFEQFKLAIVNHRVAGWKEVTCDEVLDVLDALRELALAPMEG